jgi:uncharacterized protein YejL (UPF0352 family)
MVAKRQSDRPEGRQHRSGGAAAVGVFDSVREQAAELTDLARRGAREVKNQVSEKVGQVAGAAREEVNQVLDERKRWAAARVDRFASATQKTARVLTAANMDRLGDYVQRAADEVDEVSRYLEDTDVAQIIDDVADVAKRHPAITLGSMFAVGLVIGRVVKAAQAPAEEAPATDRRGAGKSRPSSGNETHARNGTQARRQSSARRKHGGG